MPALTQEEQNRLKERRTDTCRECQQTLSRNYCRECDEYFSDGHRDDCKSGATYDIPHTKHRKY